MRHSRLKHGMVYQFFQLKEETCIKQNGPPTPIEGKLALAPILADSALISYAKS